MWRKILLMVLCLIPLTAMGQLGPQYFTPNSHLAIPPAGYANYSTYINQNFSTLDSVMAGTAANPWGFMSGSSFVFKTISGTALFSIDQSGNGSFLNNVTIGGTPTLANHAATKAYVDSAVSGFAPFGGTGPVTSLSGNTSRKTTPADIVGIWDPITCSTTAYIKSDGTCGNPSGTALTGDQYHLLGFTGSGTSGAFAAGELNYTTDSTGSDLLGVRNLSATGNFNLTITDPTVSTAFLMTENWTLDNISAQGGFWRNATYGGGGGINYGNGFSETGNAWTTSGFSYWNTTFNRRGITQTFSGNTAKNGLGDMGVIYMYANDVGGTSGFSDEGACGLCQRLSETPTYSTAVVTAGATTGSTTLPATITNTPCDGCYVVDSSKLTSTNNITGPFVASGTLSNYYIAPVATPVTPSTAYGNLSCPDSLSQPVPTTTRVTITCTASGILGSAGAYSVGSATVAGPQIEQVPITAVGTVSGGSQSVTFTYRYANPTLWYPSAVYKFNAGITNGTTIFRVTTPGTAGTSAPTWNNTIGSTTTDGTAILTAVANSTVFGPASLWQGGPQGNVQCHDYPQTMSGMPQCEVIFGAPDNTHIAGGVTNGGSMIAPQSGYEAPLAITNLSNVSGAVTATINTQFGWTMNAMTSALIASCSDTNLNGAITNVVYHPELVTGNLTWTQTGSTGSTCPTATIGIPTAYTAIHLYPYAEQIAAYTPGHFTLEYNNVPWTATDVLFQPHPPTGGFTGRWNTLGLIRPAVPGSVQFSSGTLDRFTGRGIANGFGMITEVNLNPASFYLGGGGRATAPTGIILQGPVSNAFSSQLPMNGNTAIALFCPGLVCNHGTYNILQVAATAGIGLISFLPDSKTWVLDNISTQNLTISGTISVPTLSSANVISTGVMQAQKGFSVYDGGTAANITLGNGLSPTNHNTINICEYYGSGFNDVCIGTPNRNQSGFYAALGNLWANSFNGGSKATLNGLDVSITPPIWQLLPTYTGTAGTNTLIYALVGYSPLGKSTVGASWHVFLAGTLGGGNSVSIACPTALQNGYPTGTTYELMRGVGVITNQTTDLGTCALGSTVIDNGAITTTGVLPTHGTGAQLWAGAVTDSQLGTSTGLLCGNGTDGTLSVTGCNYTMPALGVATSSANFNSSPLNLVGSYWNTSTSSPAADTWTFQNSIGLGASTLSISHVGLGTSNVSLPNLISQSLLVQVSGSQGVSIQNTGMTGTNSSGVTTWSVNNSTGATVFNGTLGVGGSLTAAVGLFVSGSNVASAVSTGVLDEIPGTNTTRLVSWGTSSAPGDLDFIGESPDLSHTDNYLVCSHLTGCTFNDPLNVPALAVNGGHSFTRHTTINCTLAPASVPVGVSTQTLTCSGINVGDFITAFVPASFANYVTAQFFAAGTANALTVAYNNSSGAAVVPASGNYSFDVEQ